MARKKITPEEEIVNTAVEGTALGSVLRVACCMTRQAQIPATFPQSCRR